MKFIIISCAVLAVAAAEVLLRTPITVKDSRESLPDGSYAFSFETENGILQEEKGTPVVIDPTSAPVITAQGHYHYTSPEGIPIAVSYIADHNGYHPQGDHIPQPPILIQRALEFLSAHPEPIAIHSI